MEKGQENWRAFKAFISLALPTLGLAIAVGLLTDTLKGGSWVADWNNSLNQSNPFWLSWWLGFVSALIASTLCALILYHRLPFEGLPVRTLQRDENPKAHQVLILLLSPSNYSVEINSQQLAFDYDEMKISQQLILRRKVNDKPESHLVNLSADIATDDASLQSYRWNWQQTLRALSLHTSELEVLYLIGSKGKVGSLSQLERCKQFLGLYIDPEKIKQMPRAVEFEDIDEIQHLIHDCIEEAREQGYKDSQIMIDATGGLKTTSIASAVVTLHNRVKFQYVTNAGNVVTYSMIFETHPDISA